MVRVAIIGTGGMGKKYVKMIQANQIPFMKLTAAVARSETNQKFMQDTCGDDVLVVSSEDELYEHADAFDAVIIATPHRYHPEMGLRALRSGKHVLLEKPIGVSVADCEELLTTAEQSGLKFSVIFHQRAYPKYMAIKKLLDEDALGEIYRVMMENTRYFRTEHYHHSSSWRSSWNGEGGGALINQGQHILDMWQWLFGMPEAVRAEIAFGKYNDFDVDDEATLFFQYPNHKTGIFFLTTGEGNYIERLEISGSKGSLLLEEDTLMVHTYEPDLNTYRKEAGVNSREDLHETVLKKEFPLDTETHPVILENFAKAIECGEPLLVEGADAIHALELTNAAYLSAWKHETVSFPLDRAAYQQELEAHQKNERH